MHSYVLACFMGSKILVCCSWSTKVPWQGSFGQNLPCSQTMYSHQNYCQVVLILRMFQLYRIHAVRLQTDFLKNKSQLAIVTVLNSIKLSWSLLLVELASMVVQRRGFVLCLFSSDCLAAVWRTTDFFSWNPFIVWVPLINYLSPGLLKTC